jgi:hypothetical protein
MTHTQTTEQSWRDCVRDLYPDASPDEIHTDAQGLYFRLRPGRDGSYVGAWFPRYAFGFVDSGAVA